MTRLSITFGNETRYVSGSDFDDAKAEAIRFCEERGILNAEIARADWKPMRPKSTAPDAGSAYRKSFGGAR